MRSGLGNTRLGCRLGWRHGRHRVRRDGRRDRRLWRREPVHRHRDRVTDSHHVRGFSAARQLHRVRLLADGHAQPRLHAVRLCGRRVEPARDPSRDGYRHGRGAHQQRGRPGSAALGSSHPAPVGAGAQGAPVRREHRGGRSGAEPPRDGRRLPPHHGLSGEHLPVLGARVRDRRRAALPGLRRRRGGAALLLVFERRLAASADQRRHRQLRHRGVAVVRRDAGLPVGDRHAK